MELEMMSYTLGLAGVGSDFLSMSSVCCSDSNSEDEPIFQPIAIVLLKLVSFRGIGQVEKLMWSRLCEQGVMFSLREDPLKMTLVLFVERFLFGANYRKTVSLWLFSLAEDMEQFNSFPWGKFVFQMTLHYLNNAPSHRPGKDTIRWHFYGFPIILQVRN